MEKPGVRQTNPLSSNSQQKRRNTMSATSHDDEYVLAEEDSTSRYSVAAGADNATVNSVVSSVYTSLYPRIFRGSVPVGQLGIASVGFDFQAVPAVHFNPSELAGDLFREQLEPILGADDAMEAAAELLATTFEATCSRVSLTVSYSDGRPPATVTGSLRAAAQVNISPTGTMTFRIVGGVVTLPNDPLLEEILNRIFVPILVEYLNTNFLSPIQIPPISFRGVTLQAPQAVIQNGTLLTFSALQPPVTPPGPGTWPSAVAFVGTDATVLNAVGNAALPSPAGEYEYRVNIGLCTAIFSARYGVSLRNLQISFHGGNTFSARMNASASGGASARCGIVRLSLGLIGSGIIGATVRIIVSGNQVRMELVNISNPGGILVRLTGFLGFLRPILGPILSGLASAIFALIANTLRGYIINVFTIPQIHFTLAGISFAVTLQNPAVTTVAGPGSVSLATVTSRLQVTASTLEVPEELPEESTAAAALTA
jgi:hypothetical protein